MRQWQGLRPKLKGREAFLSLQKRLNPELRKFAFDGNELLELCCLRREFSLFVFWSCHLDFS